MGPQEYPKWHDTTCSDTEAPKMSFPTKITKMPLVNLGLTEGQIRSNSIQNNTFHSFSSNSSFSEILATLTKFDLKLISCRPKNPNFDLIVRTCWNQCHCEDYQILIPMTIHGSKLELKRLRYHENWVNASINAPLTSWSHNFWSNR